jgi:hypothetical protein
MLYGTIHGFGVSLSLLLSLTPPWLAWCTGGGALCIALDIDLEDRRVVEENSPLYSVT